MWDLFVFFHISAVLSFLLASSSTVWMYQSLFIHSTSWLRQSGLGLFFFFLTEVLLIYSTVLVSGVQQHYSFFFMAELYSSLCVCVCVLHCVCVLIYMHVYIHILYPSSVVEHSGCSRVLAVLLCCCEHWAACVFSS